LWTRYASERRKGYANGFKPKTLDTRLGAITFQVPQTRGVEFYPVGSIYIDVDQMWIFLEVGVGMVGTFSADL